MTWTGPLARLVAIHGAARVWRVGLEALNYPPTWADTEREIKAVADALNATR